MAWARYQLRERLGEGGMGVVFAAFDPELDREVALKVLHDEQLSRAGQERLRREARALARVTHPNVVPVYDVGEHTGRLYYTMERVRGRSLREWAREPHGWREVQRVFLDTARGLAAIHAAGLVHRDVKPGNVLIGDDGRARVADLGIVAGAAGPGGSTIVDTTTLRGAGTSAYMAPEQLDGALGDAAADQFALGVALDETLHGRLPFRGDTVAERRAAIAAGPMGPAREVPAWLDRVARRAMAEAPGERFADVIAMAAALAGPRPRRWPYAVVALAAVGGAAAVTLVLAGGGAGPRCDDLDRELAGVWDPAARDRLHASFGEAGLSYGGATAAELTRRLDAYAGEWSAARAAACRAAASPTRERRELCLDRRRDQLRRVAGVLGRAGVAVIDRGTTTLGGLEPVSDCGDPAYLAAVAVDRSAGARELLAQARVAAFAGAEDEALAAGRQAAVEARRVGDRTTLAEALIVTAAVQRDRGELGPSIDGLRAAFEAAGEPGRVRIDAWIELGLSLQSADRFDDAADALDRADAALAAAPDPVRRIRALSARGTLLGRRSDYTGAAAMFERVRALAVDTYGPDSWQVASMHENLTTALRRLGRGDEALAHSRRALELKRVLGAEHPRVLSARKALAQAMGAAGLHTAAVAELQALLEHQRRRLGDDHVEVAAARVSLAVALHPLKRHEEAAVLLHAALTVQSRVAPSGMGTLNTRAILAETFSALGRDAEAEPLHRAVLEARLRLLGPDHVDVGMSRWNLGSAVAALGRFDEAKVELDRARAILVSRLGAAHAHVAGVDRVLARLPRRAR